MALSGLTLAIVAMGLMILNGYDQILLRFLEQQEEFSRIQDYMKLMEDLKESGYSFFLGITAISVLYLLRVFSHLSSDIKALTAFISHASKTNMLINRQVFRFNEFRSIADRYNLLVKDRMSDYKNFSEKSIHLKRIEKEVKSTIEHTAMIVNKLPFPLYIIDASVDSRVLNSNISFLELIGFGEEFFVGGSKEVDLLDFGESKDLSEGGVYDPSAENATLALRTKDLSKSNVEIPVGLDRKRKVFCIHRVPFIDNQDKCISILVVMLPREETT